MTVFVLSVVIAFNFDTTKKIVSDLNTVLQTIRPYKFDTINISKPTPGVEDIFREEESEYSYTNKNTTNVTVVVTQTQNFNFQQNDVFYDESIGNDDIAIPTYAYPTYSYPTKTQEQIKWEEDFDKKWDELRKYNDQKNKDVQDAQKKFCEENPDLCNR